MKYHEGIPCRKAVIGILLEQTAAKESTNAVDNSVENALMAAFLARRYAVSSQIGQKNVKFLLLLKIKWLERFISALYENSAPTAIFVARKRTLPGGCGKKQVR